VLTDVWGLEEGTGDWRRLHDEELHHLYCLHIIIRVITSRGMRWVGHVARTCGEKRNAYRFLVGKTEGKRPLGKPRRRWNDMKIILKEQDGNA
jgi:hypothetical protein